MIATIRSTCPMISLNVSVVSFTVVGQPDTGPHAFYVRDVGGQMKVFVHGQHWMFQ